MKNVDMRIMEKRNEGAVYKITLYDENCSPICEGVTTFFTDDINTFEENWFLCAEKEQVERYKRSKAGELVTDYYGPNPKLNIFQEDKVAEILFERNLFYADKEISLVNTYDFERTVFAKEIQIKFQGIRFAGEYFLIGSYVMDGVCQKSIFSNKTNYEPIKTWGNPVFISKIQEKDIWIDSPQGRMRNIYKKQDFKEDRIETYCFVTVGKFSKEELLNVRPNLEAEAPEMLIRLFRDILGEAG